jgi:hypothetical protein
MVRAIVLVMAMVGAKHPERIFRFQRPGIFRMLRPYALQQAGLGLAFVQRQHALHQPHHAGVPGRVGRLFFILSLRQ